MSRTTYRAKNPIFELLWISWGNGRQPRRLAIGIGRTRAVRRDRLESAAEYADIPLINASCPVEHPCQAFADLMTMIEKKGPVQKAKIAFCWGYRTANPPAGLTNSTMLSAGKF